MPMQRRTRQIALLFVVSFLAVGAIDARLGLRDDLHSPTFLPHVFLISFLSFWWSRADGLENDIKPPNGAAILCALFPLFGVPFQMFRTRPWRRAVLSISKGAAVLVVAMLAYEAGGYLVA